MRSNFPKALALWPLLAAAPLSIALPSCHSSQTDNAVIEAKLVSILDAQDEAWSAGDIDAFMESYWKSPELRFASGGKINRGWEATRDGYYTRYPNPNVMGKLITDDYEVDVLSPNAAIVHGSWELEREGEPASGLYTLVFKKIGGKWVITSDTTTSAN